MQVDPKTSAWIMGAITVMSAVAGMGATAFPDYVPAHLAAEIVQTDAFLLALVGAVATGLHLYSSSDPGPLAPADPPVVKAAIAAAAKSAGAIALGLLLGLALALGSPGPARAAAPAAKTGLKIAIPSGVQQVIDFILQSPADATTLATKIPALQDGNGQACWSEMQGVSAALKARLDYTLLSTAVDLETFRLAMAAAYQVCHYDPCTKMFDELDNQFAAWGAGVNALAMSTVCGKITVETMVTPFVTPTPTSSASAPAPAPSATPAPTPTGN